MTAIKGEGRDTKVWRSAIRCRVEIREGIRISATRWAKDNSTVCLVVASGLPVTHQEWVLAPIRSSQSIQQSFNHRLAAQPTVVEYSLADVGD